MMQRLRRLHGFLTAGLFGLVVSTCLPPVEGSDHGQSDRITYPVPSAIVKIIDSVNVPAEFSGVLAELNYREGQMVRMGDELAKMKNDELQLRLARAEIENKISRTTAENDIDVRFAVKSLEFSSNKVVRSKRSNERVPGVVSTARLQEQQLEEHRDLLRVEQAKRDQKISSMKVELATTDVALTKLVLERSSIRSPIDGMVISVSAKPGEWVEPGQSLVKIVRMNRLKIEGFVPASIASQLRIGDPATAVINQEWLKGTVFEGKVMFINPEANPVNSNVQIWVEIDNQELKVIPGLEANLTVKYEQR